MSLYLKYRPSDFTNLVGQGFVKDTLQKAIANDKTVGAYLFCGPRGTGKTSSARIFAKTINCENPDNGNPCLKCSVCLDFADDRLIDIIEIDAASHTGVDNIREIIEKAQFSPTKTKFKIYIIDEVHMLSKGAFNALLKILEEPPSHVKFILATTETHKVPETIISRCQRYDFKRISDQDIKKRLEYIAKEEGVKADSESISYIIKNSSGGLRNAISTFEQLIFDGELNYSKIVEKLEIVDENVIDAFLTRLITKDSSILDILDKNISDGKNIKLFFKELLFYTKNKSLAELKLGNNITEYINVLEILDDTYTKTKHSLDENTTFTIGVLKILNNHVNQQIKQETTIKAVPKKTVNLDNTSNAIKTEKKEVKETISADDLTDVFGEIVNEEIKEPVSNIKSSASNSSGDPFDTNTFVTKLKSNGAKGGLTMAIRGCILTTSGNTLNISAKTKIAKGQVENVDNVTLIIKSLSDMGLNDYKINIQ